MPINYAVVGLGQFARGQILPAFRECQNSNCVAVVTGNPDRARQQADQWGYRFVYDYDHFDDCCRNPEVDALYIALSNSRHTDFTVRAAQLGKHVLCEKPMATSVAEAVRMRDACRNAGVKLMIGYRCHFDPGNREAIRRVRAGEIGQPRQVLGEGEHHLHRLLKARLGSG
ncbi:MAG: Gfo/Idh/MocA family oxidoreductase, partial [Armatimonadetes bacterium]|nr:Gfo/Idh/MocA family oxidoreductase [Armatimonadota bacterium]